MSQPIVQSEVLDLAKRLAPARQSLIQFTEMTHGRYVVRDVHHLIAGKLQEVAEAVARGIRRKLMIFIPPRRGKSELASVRFPAWMLGRQPNIQLIQASYNQDLANKFSRQARGVVTSELFQLIFPEVSIAPNVQSVKEWEVEDTAGAVGTYRAAGAGGGITGTGAHVLLVDDPVKDAEEAKSERIQETRYDWYISTARTRLMPGASEIIIMTRWHMNDLAGMLLAEEDDWEVLTIPFKAVSEDDPLGRDIGEFIDDGRFSLEECQKTWDDLDGTPLKRFTRNALYQQDPSPLDSMPFQNLATCEWTLESPEAREFTIFIVVDSAQSKDKRRDDTAIQVGGINATSIRPIFYAEEINERPAERNLRILDVARRVRASTGFRKLWVEGDNDMIHSLKMTFRDNGEHGPDSFVIEQLSPGGRNKEARIEEVDNYVSTLRFGPEAEIARTRLLQWSRTSGTPDHHPDCTAYFCETASYTPGASKSWSKWDKPPKDPMARQVWKAQRKKHKQGPAVPEGW